MVVTKCDYANLASVISSSLLIQLVFNYIFFFFFRKCNSKSSSHSPFIKYPSRYLDHNRNQQDNVSWLVSEGFHELADPAGGEVIPTVTLTSELFNMVELSYVSCVYVSTEQTLVL